MASQVFWIINHCGITSGFNKAPGVYCLGAFLCFSCRPLKWPRNLELKFTQGIVLPG